MENIYPENEPLKWQIPTSYRKCFMALKHRRKPTTEIKRMEEEIQKLERGTPQNNILKPIMDYMKEDKAKQT